MKFLNTQNIPSTSITPTFNGTAIATDQMLYISAQVITSSGSSPSATVKMQASNDIPSTSPSGLPNQFVPTNWTDVSGATVTITTNGTLLIPKTEICYRWVRFVVTFTSGTGNVSVNVFGICA